MKKLASLASLSVLALALLGLVVLGGCQQDTKNLEKKIDEINKKVDEIAKNQAAGARPGAAGAAAGQAPRPARPTADPTKTYSVNVDGLPFEGDPDAKITIVKGYEYACPYCEKVRPTMDELKKKYGKDIRIAYKQFVVHPQIATAPSLAACAANKQGKFTAMDAAIWDKVFKTRAFDKAPDPSNPAGAKQCWEAAEGCPNLVAQAKEVGLNVDKFKADMKECVPQIQKEQRELQQLGMSATPGFFVNGRFLSGAQPVEAFVALIDEELKKASERIGQGTKQADYYKTWIVDKGLKVAEMPK